MDTVTALVSSAAGQASGTTTCASLCASFESSCSAKPECAKCASFPTLKAECPYAIYSELVRGVPRGRVCAGEGLLRHLARRYTAPP